MHLRCTVHKTSEYADSQIRKSAGVCLELRICVPLFSATDPLIRQIRTWLQNPASAEYSGGYPGAELSRIRVSGLRRVHPHQQLTAMVHVDSNAPVLS